MGNISILNKRLSPVYRYLEYLPKGYDPKGNTSWPLILFLHGAGERGSDLEILKGVGLPPALERNPVPFIVITPQIPERETWGVSDLASFMDYLAGKYRIDERRQYLTGISMGGFATWYFAAHRPDLFAAIAPICGGGNSAQAKKLVHVPVWAFHGADDKVVSPDNSRRMVRELERLGGNVLYTEYPDTGHDSWTRTYGNPALYRWFLRFRRK